MVVQQQQCQQELQWSCFVQCCTLLLIVACPCLCFYSVVEPSTLGRWTWLVQFLSSSLVLVVAATFGGLIVVVVLLHFFFSLFLVAVFAFCSVQKPLEPVRSSSSSASKNFSGLAQCQE